MNCIVTAGPTYEELDEVRRLTNFSTGTLGAGLADFLAGQGHRVLLLRGHYATAPSPVRRVECQPFTTTEDLQRRLRDLASGSWEAVFHAAAVSDFGFGNVWRRTPEGILEQTRSAKLSTRSGELLVELRPTPKILSLLRGWFPAAVLAGWKYELEGDREAAMARARRQLTECGTDLCVVNGRAYGGGYGLLAALGSCEHAESKEALFDRLGDFLGGKRQPVP